MLPKQVLTLAQMKDRYYKLEESLGQLVSQIQKLSLQIKELALDQANRCNDEELGFYDPEITPDYIQRQNETINLSIQLKNLFSQFQEQNDEFQILRDILGTNCHIN